MTTQLETYNRWLNSNQSTYKKNSNKKKIKKMIFVYTQYPSLFLNIGIMAITGPRGSNLGSSQFFQKYTTFKL